MPQGMDRPPGCAQAGAPLGGPEGALDTAPTQRRGRGRALLVIPFSGGKEPRGVPMSLPGGAQPREGLSGQGNVPILGVLPTVDRALEALAIKVRALQRQGCMEPETQAGDGGKGDVSVHGSRGRPEALDLLDTEDGGETGGDLRAHERQGIPVALADVLIEEAATAGAEAHGRGGQAIDIFPVQAGVL
jgi:hypothetical protein